MKELNINVKGSYGETNFGDDLLMLVFENFFRKEFKNAEINFEGINAEYPSKLLKSASYNKSIKNSDWNVFGGGTQFFSFNENGDLSFIDKIKLYLKNPHLIKNKFIKSESKVNTAFLGFGIGPFSNNIRAINNSRNIIKTASFVAVRDDVSYKYCNDWQIKATLGADVVFSSYYESDNSQLIKNEDHSNKIGIIVRDWDYENSGNAYIEVLKKFYKENSDNFKIIIFAPNKDKKWIKSLKQSDVIIWDPNTNNVQEFLGILDSFKALISARYHGAIIGALLNKPIICIEVESKLRILTEQVNEMQLWEKPFNIKQLEELIQNINYTVDYKESLEERKILADNMLNEFKKHI